VKNKSGYSVITDPMTFTLEMFGSPYKLKVDSFLERARLSQSRLVAKNKQT